MVATKNNFGRSYDLPSDLHFGVVVLLGLGSILVNVLNVAIWAGKNCGVCSSHIGWPLKGYHKCRYMLGRAMGLTKLFHAVKKDALSLRIKEEFTNRRTKYGRRGVKLIACLMSLRMAQMIGAEQRGEHREMNKRQDIMYVFNFVVVTVFSTFSRHMDSFRLDTLISYFFFTIILYMSPLITPPSEIYWVWLNFFFATVGLAIVCNSARLTTYWSIAIQVTTLIGQLSLDKSERVISFPRNVVDVFLIFCLEIIVIWFYHCNTWSVVQSEVRALASKVELGSVYSLLRSQCDVIVELDTDLRVSKHSEQLAAILFLNPNRNTEAIEICEFLSSDEDKTSFIDFMNAHRSCVVKGKPVSHFYTQMRDSSANVLRMEFLTVCNTGVDSKVSFLLGMREVADDAPLAPLLHGGANADLKKHQSQQQTRDDISSESSSSSWSKVCLDADDPFGARAIVGVDARIIVCCPNFASLGGTSSLEYPIKNWFAEGKWFQLRRDVDAMLKIGSSDSCCIGSLLLQPPALSNVFIECNCEVSHADLPVIAEHVQIGSGEPLVQFSFSDIKFRTRTQYRAQRRASKSPSSPTSAYSREGEQVTRIHTFSGEMGIVCNDAGIMMEVIANKAAHRQGMSTGYQILEIDGMPYSNEALTMAESSGTDYEIMVVDVADMCFEFSVTTLEITSAKITFAEFVGLTVGNNSLRNILLAPDDFRSYILGIMDEVWLTRECSVAPCQEAWLKEACEVKTISFQIAVLMRSHHQRHRRKRRRVFNLIGSLAVPHPYLGQPLSVKIDSILSTSNTPSMSRHSRRRAAFKDFPQRQGSQILGRTMSL